MQHTSPQLAVFDDLTSDQVNNLMGIMKIYQFPKEFVIFNQGDAACSMYILLNGEVKIIHKLYDDDGPPMNVATIMPGGVFGWSAALRRDSYTATASTTCPSSAYRIHYADLYHFYHKDSQTGNIYLKNLASVITNRLHNTHTEIYAILNQGMNEEATDNDSGSSKP
jgi:CRP-like cAMP-binding protein